MPVRNYVRPDPVSGHFTKDLMDLSSFHNFSRRSDQSGDESTSGGPASYPPHFVAIFGGVLGAIFLLFCILMAYYYFKKSKRPSRFEEED